MGIVFCKDSFIGELFWHSRIYDGYHFQKFARFMGLLLRYFSGFMGILLRNFSEFMGDTFTISMAQPRILETQVIPPPPPRAVLRQVEPRPNCSLRYTECAKVTMHF